jgi:hypothetical protein
MNDLTRRMHERMEAYGKSDLTKSEDQLMNQYYVDKDDSDELRLWKREVDAWNNQLQNPMYGKK